jgi:hypothetical protein
MFLENKGEKMKEYKVKQDAKRLIILMIISCKGFDDWRDTSGENLRSLMEEKREMTISELMGKLGGKSSLGFRLSQFAEENNKSTIDLDLVIKFFGGTEHIAHASAEGMILKQKGEDRERVDKFIVGHLELPLEEVVRNGDTYEGVYRNGPINIRIKGLVSATEKEIKIEKDKKIICHFSLITDAEPREEVVEWLKKEQASHNGFMEVAKRVSEIDYTKFWNLSEITKNIMKEGKK